MPTLPSRALIRAAMVALTLLPACRSSAPPPKPKPDAGATAPATPGAEPDVEVATVIAPARRYGLEITWWIADDSDGSLSRTLTSLALPDQRIDPATIERLRAQGLRPVRISESSLLALTDAAAPTAGIERLWIGLAPDWTPTRLPPPFEPSTVRTIPGLGAPVEVAMLRLVWRAYLSAENLAPILRVDLTGQAISADYARHRMSVRSAGSAGEARLPRPVDAGPMIDTLESTIVMRPREVIVIVGDNPDTEWGAKPADAILRDDEDPYAPPPLPPEAAPSAPEEPEPPLIDAEDLPPAPSAPPDATASEATPSATEEDPIAPRTTFGEIVLSPELPTRPGRPGRLVIALIPQIPERLELIPKPRPQP